MRVRIERSGGFANIAASAEADTTTMSEAEGAELRSWVHSLRFGSGNLPDAFQYHVTIEEDDGTAISAPADAEALFEWLSVRG